MTFAYDATGLRRKTEAAAGTTSFIWDGRNVLMETDGSGTTQVAYTQARGVYGPLVSLRHGGAVPLGSFFHFDALGSATELSNAAETATDSYRYFALGQALAATGSTPNPFRYVGALGYYNEASLALQYLRARWYHPAAGRFVARDGVALPADEGTGPNRYVYVVNGPAAHVDPSGRDRYDLCKGFGWPWSWICRKGVDLACERDPGDCCDGDRADCNMDCMDKYGCGVDRGYLVCIDECTAKWEQCLIEAGLKPPEPD